MANILQPVRGTRDIIGNEALRHAHVVETARRVTALYGFSEWQTPIFEDTRVFSRTLGETSDVVAKEMYTFDDRGGDSITLRPEGTAGVCRALVTAGLAQTLPQKVFYQGPMFRYERPQKGRYRQFHQIGVELLGPSSSLTDAEVIACGWHLLQELGLSEIVELNINTLGDIASRDNYRAALIEYFSTHESDLSEDSKTRLKKNPLRILDSKDQGDIEICANAPLVYQHLTEEAAAHYDNLQKYLLTFGVPFRPNPHIVRGLDYYNHTAFEFVTKALGSQGTVLAGGRYDGLVEQMGGPSVPGVGWAAGIDRLALLLNKVSLKPPPVAILFDDALSEAKALSLLKLLRDAGIAAEVPYQTSHKKRLERVNKSASRLAIMAITSFMDQGKVVVIDLEAVRQKFDPSLRRDFQRTVDINNLTSELKQLLDSFSKDIALKKFADRLQITASEN